MLKFLKVKNFLIIKQIEIEFFDGFNSFIGESGSGKSIIFETIQFVLGKKSDKTLIGNFGDETEVIAIFDSISAELNAVLEEAGLNCESIILRRTLNKKSTGKIYFNDTPVSAEFIKNIADYLADFHSQFDQQIILKTESHIRLLDKFADNNTNLLSRLFEQLKELEKDLNAKEQLLASRTRDVEYLEESLRELKEIDLKENEYEELVTSKTEFTKQSKIIADLNSLTEILDFSEAKTKILSALKLISKVNLADEGAFKLNERLDNIFANIEEIEVHVNELAHKDFDENYLEYVESRLSIINKLARKFQIPPTELILIESEFSLKLDAINKLRADIENVKKTIEEVRKDFLAKAHELSKIRLNASHILKDKLEQILKELNFNKVDFLVSFEQNEERKSWNKFGIDKISFLASFNPGLERREIGKIASGGELSRFMLALKCALTSSKSSGSLFLDEIDSGVSGKTAYLMGGKIKELSKSLQIFTITHNPLLALLADNHYLVKKNSANGITELEVKNIEAENAKKHIATMLATEEYSKEALELLEKLK